MEQLKNTPVRVKPFTDDDFPILLEFISKISTKTYQSYINNKWFIAADVPEEIKKYLQLESTNKNSGEFTFNQKLLNIFTPEGLRGFKKAFNKFKSAYMHRQIKISAQTYATLNAVKQKFELDSIDDVIEHLIDQDKAVSEFLLDKNISTSE